MELDPHADGRPVVKGGQKIRKCGQFVIEPAVVAALDRVTYHVAEQLPSQYSVTRSAFIE